MGGTVTVTMRGLLLSLLLMATAAQLSRARWCPAHHNTPPCYFKSEEAMTWYEAQEYCSQRGGYLAELATQAEDTSLNSHLDSEAVYWIGATDAKHEGGFGLAKFPQSRRSDKMCGDSNSAG